MRLYEVIGGQTQGTHVAIRCDGETADALRKAHLSEDEER